MFRRPVNKQRSAKQFRRNTKRTKQINLRGGASRGGIRL